MASITFEIKKTIAVLGHGTKGWKRELNLISWNGAEPKYDIRDWDPDHIKMGKGITLSREEAGILLGALAVDMNWVSATPQPEPATSQPEPKSEPVSSQSEPQSEPASSQSEPQVEPTTSQAEPEPVAEPTGEFTSEQLKAIERAKAMMANK